MSDQHRYLIIAEGAFGPETSKTANRAMRYLPERVVRVLDSQAPGRTSREVLGFGGDIPVVRSIEEGFALNPTAVRFDPAPLVDAVVRARARVAKAPA